MSSQGASIVCVSYNMPGGGITSVKEEDGQKENYRSNNGLDKTILYEEKRVDESSTMAHPLWNAFSYVVKLVLAS